jgi:glucose/arabinose dehydrogenase
VNNFNYLKINMKLINIFHSRTLLLATILVGLASCTFIPSRQASNAQETTAQQSSSKSECTLVEEGFGEWQGNLIIATLGSEHLHRVVFDPQSLGSVQSHEVYLQDEFGRLREAIASPDGELYITTSNCDGRGTCPPEQDKILRIVR